MLLAYFSRPGENYYYGDRTWLEVGNTEVVATTIAELIACDVYKIEAADPYPDIYDETVARNVREQDQDARPEIAGRLPDVNRYDVVLLGSPIWNVRAPMIMSTFTEALDLSGKTIHPFTTHAMSGLGTTERDYAATCPGASIGEGIAIQGEESTRARAPLGDWLRRIGLATV
ncbi:flavodoxin [Nocardioides sp. LML1-1-1.1]|uniref:flavodoxin n=1 Tax=Nocardioides sp. LML1-1-1.1 TaxID=3135248 RepID=UPI00342F069F